METQLNPMVIPPMHQDIEEVRQAFWNYHSIIGMTNFGQQSTMSNSSMMVQQCE